MKSREANRVLIVLSQSKWRLFNVFSKYTLNFTHVLRLLPYSQLLSTPTTPNWETFKTSEKKITLLRVIPTMTCRVVVVRWGLSGCFVSPIFPTRDKEPCRNPSHLFSRLLRALVVSCPPFSVAPGTSVCESKAQTCRRRNMRNHVRTPPGKHISINRHQTCQYTS